MTLRVPREALPALASARADVLSRYFDQLVVRAIETEDGWNLELDWADQAAMYVDPDLHSGLEWWSREYGALSVGTIPTTFSQQDGFLLAVEDAWTLYGWSRWLRTAGEDPEVLTILHLDDHTDFMSPRVIAVGSTWRDAITGQDVNVRSPESVASAIRSGAIGIGSFIAPFAHALPSLDVRHLCARHYARARMAPVRLLPVLAQDTLLVPGGSRIALKQEAGVATTEGHRYHATDDLDVWLAELPSGPVLLHIDMDYFNCRYDGDSDWAAQPHRHDPPLDRVLARIDEVFAALRATKTMERIEDVVVALSPSFFPAELWPKTVERIARHLSER
jgi:hypothetical protein